jgi:hypothetical protein
MTLKAAGLLAARALSQLGYLRPDESCDCNSSATKTAATRATTIAIRSGSWLRLAADAATHAAPPSRRTVQAPEPADLARSSWRLRACAAARPRPTPIHDREPDDRSITERGVDSVTGESTSSVRPGPAAVGHEPAAGVAVAVDAAVGATVACAQAVCPWLRRRRPPVELVGGSLSRKTWDCDQKAWRRPLS